MNQQTRNILFMVSSIAVIIGAAMPLFMLKMPWVPYIYAFGAAGMAVCRLTFRYKGKNFRLKRLYHIETPIGLCCLLSPLSYNYIHRFSFREYQRKKKNKLLPTTSLTVPRSLTGCFTPQNIGRVPKGQGG